MIHRTLISLSASLILSLMSPYAYATDPQTHHEAVTVCETALAPMREVMATRKQGGTLTSEQEALWRTWNQQCRHASWQHALAEGLPPVPREPAQSLAAQRTSSDAQMRLAEARERARHPWREALIKGLERAADAPITSCRTTYAQKGNRAGSYTTCTTY